LKIDPKHLKYFLDEDLYLLKQKPPKDASNENGEEPTDKGQIWVLIDADDQRKNDKLLKKIIAAANLSLDDIEIFNTISESQLESNHTAILSFGKPFLNVVSSYQIVERGKKKHLLVDSLSVIDKDRNKKKALWARLKKMFNIL